MPLLTDPEAPILLTAFADPTTRSLLANDGTTTSILEAVLRAPVTVEVRHQALRRADDLGPALTRDLELTGTEPVLLRDSVLFGPGRQPASVNRAVIVATPDNPLYPLCEDRRRPLGPALLSAGIPHSRRLLSTGHYPWPLDTGTPAAGKRYLIRTEGRPRLHLTEIYNPALFPADLT
ncbi:chorismate--pyruvate lyase family protein [Nocardia sp. SSK8]|uniref:chorismate--pyruvate lyase family protein n=1 Tax=Nocardia sp. SSK8 TaxID=3120154 RepID=UPI0030095A40